MVLSLGLVELLGAWGLPAVVSVVGLFAVSTLVAVGLVVGGSRDDDSLRPLARDGVFDGMQSGLVALDTDAVVLDANDRARQVLAADDEALVGTALDRFEPALATAVQRAGDAGMTIDTVVTDIGHSRIEAIDGQTEVAWLVTMRSDLGSDEQSGFSPSSVIEATDTPLFAVDDSGAFRLVNEAFTDIFGGDPETIPGMHLSVVIDEAVAGRLVDRVLHASADELPETITLDVTTIDGTEQLLEARLTAFEGGVLGRLRDVTEIEHCRRDVSRYRTIVDAMTEPAGAVDDSGQFTAANESLARTSGYPQSMLLQQQLGTLVGGAGVRRIESLVDRLRATDQRRGTVETELLTRSGEERSVELECALFDEETGDGGFACIFRDMSTKRQRKSDLQQYETIVEGLADPVWTISSEGEVTFVNRAFEDKTGHRREQLNTAGADLVDLVATDDVGRLRTMVGQLVHGDHDDQATVELDLLTRDELEIPVEMKLTPLPDRPNLDPKYRGVAAVARDITDRRRRQEVLTVTNRVLRHNLRTHANMISGYADMLGKIAEDDDAETYIGRINESTDWLSKLGETLRDLQRAVEQNRTPSEPLSVESIAELGTSYETQYPEATVETTIDTEDAIDAGPAFSRAVEQVLENAIVHNDTDDPQVSITARSEETDEETWLLLSIADNGPGIPDTERAVVLGETEVTQLQHGSGIGLWATRWLVQTVGGEIEISDNDPRGTIVTLRLPTTERSDE
jgi:PAS domain S-box-containing protein